MGARNLTRIHSGLAAGINRFEFGTLNPYKKEAQEKELPRFHETICRITCSSTRRNAST